MDMQRRMSRTQKKKRVPCFFLKKKNGNQLKKKNLVHVHFDTGKKKKKKIRVTTIKGLTM